MQLDTINTLYLELSQVATATTAKELALRAQLNAVSSILWPDDTQPVDYEPDLATRLRAMLTLRDKHADSLAAQLAECAGYIASVRTDRQITHHEELYALQTVEWAEGAYEIAEKANAMLEAHDNLRALQANDRDQPRPDPQ
jgi:hypothetical protein